MTTARVRDKLEAMPAFQERAKKRRPTITERGLRLYPTAIESETKPGDWHPAFEIRTAGDEWVATLARPQVVLPTKAKATRDGLTLVRLAKLYLDDGESLADLIIGADPDRFRLETGSAQRCTGDLEGKP